MPPKKRSSTTAKPKTAAELARPHKHMFHDQAHAIVCTLRLDKNLAKYYCPTLVDERGVCTVNGKTNAGDILVAMYNKLGGDAAPSRKQVPTNASKNARGAVAFNLTRRQGRANKAMEIADAAAKLVKQRGRAQVLRDAEKRRRGSARCRRAKVGHSLKLGKFTTRGNAIVPAKKAAVVEVRGSMHLLPLLSPAPHHAPPSLQVEQFASWVTANCCCKSCKQPLKFCDKGSLQAR